MVSYIKDQPAKDDEVVIKNDDVRNQRNSLKRQNL